MYLGIQVSVEGIEPSATRLKVGYSTTELHAHHLDDDGCYCNPFRPILQ